MKLKTERVKIEGGGEIEVLRITDGTFLYENDEGKDVQANFPKLLTAHKEGIEAREALAGKLTAAETELASYKKLGALDDVAKATEQAAKLKTGELLTIEKVGEIEKRAAEKRDAEWKATVEAKDAERSKLEARIDDAELLSILNGVAGSKKTLANNKEMPIFAVPGDGLFALHRPHARKVDGKWLWSTETGENWERGVLRDEFKQPITDPLVAVQELGKSKPWLFAPPPGGGSGVGNDGPGGGGSTDSNNPATLIAQGLGIKAA